MPPCWQRLWEGRRRAMSGTSRRQRTPWSGSLARQRQPGASAPTALAGRQMQYPAGQLLQMSTSPLACQDGPHEPHEPLMGAGSLPAHHLLPPPSTLPATRTSCLPLSPPTRRMRICFAFRGNVKKAAKGVPACSYSKPCKVRRARAHSSWLGLGRSSSTAGTTATTGSMRRACACMVGAFVFKQAA